jgi:hypothetical protein
LIVELAESSLSRDRGRKARLYPESDVPKYWVVNLVDRRVEVHTEPARGVCQRVTHFGRERVFACRSSPFSRSPLTIS